MKTGNFKHGHHPKKGKASKEYIAWGHMKQRCINPAHPAYKNYGGRGISFCEAWYSFENFLKDVGLAPSKYHSLDRINNNGNYEPENVRWATEAEQQANKRRVIKLTHDGITKSISEWAK